MSREPLLELSWFLLALAVLWELARIAGALESVVTRCGK